MRENTNENTAGQHCMPFALQIGCGRLGLHLNRHLKNYFKDKVRLFDRDSDLEKTLMSEDFKYIFLCVPDSELDDCIDKISGPSKIVHFSGFYYNSKALGVHPVQSFSKEGEYDFDSIDFVVDGDLDATLKEVFKKRTKINPKVKKTYHTYLSVAANSLQLLLNRLGEGFSQQTELPKELLKNIVLQSLEREKAFGEKSFSGPWTRGENQKQNEHVEALGDANLKDLNELFKNTIKRYEKEVSR